MVFVLGGIPETHHSVLPDNNEITTHNAQCHAACISRVGFQVPVNDGNNNRAMAVNNNFPSLLQQLTHGLSAQTETLAKSNLIQNRFYQRQEVREDSKKDRTKKIHLSIIRMIGRAAASRGNESEILPASCIRFLSQDNVGMAQYDLVHQFKELNAPEFLYADSSTPSNFIIFAFRKQEPNTDTCQEDFLVCYLLREEGQKKSVVSYDTLTTSLPYPPLLLSASGGIFLGK